VLDPRLRGDDRINPTPMKLLQKLTFIIKNRRLPDETRPDDISSKSEQGHDACCDHDEPNKIGGACSVNSTCCQVGEKKEGMGCCGEDCECEK